MGETPIRLRNVTDLMVSGENKWGGFPLSLFIGNDFITASEENKKYLAWARISAGIWRNVGFSVLVSAGFRRIENN
jgi:hypothetical protein